MRHILLVVLLAAADLWTKSLVSTGMVPGESHTLLPGLLHLTYVRNTGAAFSILQGYRYLFISFTLLAGAGLLFFARRMREDFWIRTGALAAFAGAAGNLHDRIRYGYVRDFIDVPFFAVFNVADMCIVLGMLALAVRFVQIERRQAGRE